MTDASELKSALAGFTGTDGYHFNPLYRWLNYTDGVRYFAQHAGHGAYWFLDIVGTELRSHARSESFLLVTLEVKDGAAHLSAKVDSDRPEIWSRDIDFTDCPEGEWQFYLIDNVMLLPSEY